MFVALRHRIVDNALLDRIVSPLAGAARSSFPNPDEHRHLGP
jgi:hypothetical protein